MERALAERLPHLRGPQRRGLALRVLGAVLARRARARRRCSPPSCPWAPYHAPTPAPAGVAPGRGGQGGALRRAGRRRALFRALAAPGARLAAGARAGAGGRRHRAPRGRGGAGRERALPRQRHPGRLGGPARQRAGRVDGADPAPPAPAAPVAPGRAAGLDGAGAGRPRPVGARSCCGASAGLAGARRCASSGGPRSPPTVGSAARPGPGSAPARPGSAAVGSARRRAGG